MYWGWININYELFEKYFYFLAPTVLTKKLYEAKGKQWVNFNNWFKDKIKKMSKEEIENEKPDKILEIVKEILKYKEQKQQGLGLKISTPNQMLSKLPITLAQLKAGNNSEKLQNRN